MNKLKKRNRALKVIAISLIVISFVFFFVKTAKSVIVVMVFDQEMTEYLDAYVTTPDIPEVEIEQPAIPYVDNFLLEKADVENRIRGAAAEYGISQSAAVRIAMCESGFKPEAANKHSSAKGIYQFIDGTWDAIGAVGHQFDLDENIKQFMIHYPANPGWWVCK
jgi:hypothetical protein